MRIVRWLLSWFAPTTSWKEGTDFVIEPPTEECPKHPAGNLGR